jgi:L-malate glycosyltransferase
VSEGLRIAILAGAKSLHTKRWARRLVEQGHAVRVYTLNPDQIPGVPVYDLSAGHLPERTGLRRLWRTRRLNRLIDDFDPHLVQSMFLWPYGEWARKLGRRPMVHGAWGSDVFAVPNRSPRRRRQISQVIASADAITVNSESLARGVIELGARPELVRRIGWGVDVDRFRGEDDGALAEELGLKGMRIVVSPRGHKPIYNLDVIADALPEVFRRVPDAAFLFMGHGPLTDEIRARVEAAGIGERVRFRRFTEDELPRVYGAAEISVSVPSTDSGRPTSLLEAMASRLPVVLSDVPGIRELVDQDEGAEIVPIRDPAATAEAIVRLLEDPERARRFGERNRAVVTESASSRAELERCLALYDELLHR